VLNGFYSPQCLPPLCTTCLARILFFMKYFLIFLALLFIRLKGAPSQVLGVSSMNSDGLAETAKTRTAVIGNASVRPVLDPTVAI